MKNNIIELSPIIDFRKKARQLKAIGIAISQFNDDYFISSCLSAEYLKKFYFNEALQFLDGKERDQEDLENLLKRAKSHLKDLMRGRTVKI
jgi:hypothetical protein